MGKTSDALANFTTPIAPQTTFAPWGDSPQAKRLLSALPVGETPASSAYHFGVYLDIVVAEALELDSNATLKHHLRGAGEDAQQRLSGAR